MAEPKKWEGGEGFLVIKGGRKGCTCFAHQNSFPTPPRHLHFSSSRPFFMFKSQVGDFFLIVFLIPCRTRTKLRGVKLLPCITVEGPYVWWYIIVNNLSCIDSQWKRSFSCLLQSHSMSIRESANFCIST